ncbi:DUF1998 domain-containing protein [Solibacillus merdavium]|uniref:DUF1998 domain-containing protein n=1 Tax=Solibacillus merdavium TaxID=2762218 RepID=A0ABR8XLV2_9BACL|nr:DUF1998 domain-containing protein [Solibacillus merdavium]MBD8032915.1 DUF1998 domain-containing protein [Solibacillus merdavium]
MLDNEEKIRPSQLIYHSGPGAILDLLDESVMVLAADLWATHGALKDFDKRITKYLKVDHVRILNEQTDKIKVKTVRFPRWKICPKCGKMTTFNNSHCWSCEKAGRGDVKLYPSRFVTVCNFGHISDFPYDKWVHKGESCEKPSLQLLRNSESGSLSDLAVKCNHCQQIRSLGKIMKPDDEDKHLFDCTNESPWLEKKHTQELEDEQPKLCKNTMRTFLRGASNIYSPHVLSFLKVPLTETTGDNPLATILPELEVSREEYLDAGNKEKALDRIAKRYHINQNAYADLERLLMGDELNVEQSYESIRKQEWNTLSQPYFNETNIQFKSEKIDIHPKLQSYFTAIHRVDSVPEIQVLKGFSRIDYIDRFEEGDVHMNRIMQNPKQNWLPAVQNFGEGIFFVFDVRKLALWEQNETITATIIERYNHQRAEFGNEPLPLMGRHILLHTFSHALLKELAAHSGYGTTSLKERLYVDSSMHGVFIYTASGDSEGSLGGLTALSKPELLYPIVLRAIERMQYCSSDPNCSDGKFQFNLSANAAACHSCSHVSETSCEWGNQLLDRRTLLNINPHENFGFFDNLLDEE